ncbi:response regulator [Nocardioides sp. TRM66260-LWL]|uniref:response regulator n=1 Tax=Nocardioides sp. TRM66260-LWL TaxID=2874478 RepID=UPI001CC7E071|nr:response regulator [Nocardioides sp. TRM66260-LWL]MBZ5734238.1 response regulator [Nocardioides sp. TRM66260-LWL]
MRVLVVDDDPDLGLLVELFLVRAGHRVVLAADGLEALALLDQCAISGDAVELVVLDWTMPRLDGIGLCRAVRAHPRHHGLGLLMVTALADLTTPTAAGADAVLAKPFTGARLLAAVDGVAETMRRRDPLGGGRTLDLPG